MQCNATQHNTTSAMQSNTKQHNTPQYNRALMFFIAEIVCKMCLDWNSMESLGWEKFEVVEKGKKRIYFKTPPLNGIQRTIRRSRDLNHSEKKYMSILFPNAKQPISEVTIEDPQEGSSRDYGIQSIGSNTEDLVGEFLVGEESDHDCQLSQKRCKLDKCESNLFAHTNSNVDVSDNVPEHVSKLYKLIHNDNDSNINIAKMTADVLLALSEENNPFKEFPWDTSKNIFCEILDFGLKHTPDLVKLIAQLSMTDAGLNEKSVYKVSFLYSLLVCSASPHNNSSLFKLMTVMLKMSGCTGIYWGYLCLT